MISVKLLDWGEEGHRTDAEIASLRAAFTQEVAVWHKLDHPNVTKVTFVYLCKLHSFNYSRALNKFGTLSTFFPCVCVWLFLAEKLEREWGACKKENFSPLFGGAFLKEEWGALQLLPTHAQPQIWSPSPFSHSFPTLPPALNFTVMVAFLILFDI